MTRECYRIGDLTLDVGAARVTRGDREVPLPGLSFDLLVALARKAPDVVSGEELIATVWAGTAVADETLTQRVTLLRKALGDDAATPTYLRAVRGRGYQLVPAVEPLLAPAAEERPHRKRWGLAALALGLSVGAVALWPRAAPESSPVATQPASAADLLARADTYLARERPEDNSIALELYRQAAEAGGESAPVLAGWSLALAQQATKFNGGLATMDEALARAERAIEIDPRLARAQHALGLALDARGRVAPAIAAYRRAVAIDPMDRAALASAAHLLAVRGDLAAALETNLAAAASGERRPAYLDVQIGTVLALLGDRPAAAVWLERALALQPDNVFAAVAFSRLRLGEGRVAEADAIAARALAAGTRRPELAVVRARVALLAGDEPAARRHLAEAAAIRAGFGLATSLELVLDRRATASADLDARRRRRLADLEQGRLEGDEWPDSWIEQALVEAVFKPPGSHSPLAALDRAITAGWRDADLLLVDPFAVELRARPGFAARIERIRQLAAAELQGVLAAPWLPAGLLTGGNAESR